jgi:hypothetical protein
MADGPIEQDEERTRTVVAPPAIGAGALNRIVSVVIGEDEDVVWEWTDLPGGGGFVSGYMTVPREATAVDEPNPDDQAPDGVVASPG